MYAKQFEIKRYDISWENTHCRLIPSLLAFSCWKKSMPFYYHRFDSPFSFFTFLK